MDSLSLFPESEPGWMTFLVQEDMSNHDASKGLERACVQGSLTLNLPCAKGTQGQVSPFWEMGAELSWIMPTDPANLACWVTCQ